MVYCSRCGTQNPDGNVHCSNCGAPLHTVGQQYPGSDREHYKRMENECFGLPNGGMIVGIVFGVIIIIVGLSLFLEVTYSISIPFWPFIIIIVGILIVLGALFGRRSRRDFNQPPHSPT
ncbi:MAG: zinc-ribbon domain-containing protein [Candidatus Bathyarchaeota archaeon]|nr:zinc-ribbon domain-containing protein [Candidatus Bathyarchaeota archaeon]